MADIDLKTETPDTTLPTTGFLFGADSQAAASPSVYSTQTVATTLLGSTSLTGATITADAPVLNLAQTWNASGVTFTGMRFNATDTASAAGSLLLDIGTGGGTYVSRFSVSKSGNVALTGNLFSSTNALIISSSALVGVANSFFAGTSGSENWFFVGSSSTGMRSAYSLGWVNSSTNASGAIDTILTRRAAANLRLGAADAAAPVAQTLSVQSVVAGTTNTAGANLTITGSQGTGTGAGGSIVFQVAPAGSSGTAQNALVDALTIAGNRSITIPGAVTFNSGTTSHSNIIIPTGIIGGGFNSAISSGVNNFVLQAGAVDAFFTSGLAFVLRSNTTFGFSSTTDPKTTSPDTILARDAANTLALRNGTNNQELRVYGSFTSASVYDRLTLKSSSTVATVAAETDAGDMDLALTPAGSGNVQFGTHAAIAAETVTGYITIKDAGGTLRKLAVVS